MKMNRLFIQLVLLCMGLASVNLFGQKKPLITESPRSSEFAIRKNRISAFVMRK